MVAGNLARKISAPIETEVHIAESSVKWCSVSLSDVLSRQKRLEASVFDVEAKQAWERIKNGKYDTIPICGNNGLATAYTCGRFKRIWVEKSEYPIFQPSAITDIKPIPDGYLAKQTKTNIESLRVHKGQVLLTCSGTIGKASYVSKTLDNAIFSHDLLRITCQNSYDAGFLYAYLKTTVGSKILLTNSYGAVITHIEAEHLGTVLIPCAPVRLRQRIHNLIEHSYALRDESNEMINEATRLLVEELHLPPIYEMGKSNTPVSTYSVKLSQMDLRLDASYHVPVVDAIVAHLKKYAAELTTVGDARISKKVILPGRFKRTYVSKEYGRVLFGGKQLGELDPSNKKYLSISKHGKGLNKLEIMPNTILITRSGTIGKVALAPKHWAHWIPSDHIIRAVPTDDDIAGYLYVFLASDYGYPLITRYTYGSVVDEIDDNHVRQIPIPLLHNQEVQKRINTLALEANAKRYEAYKLEQQALRIMNDEVIFAK